MGLDKTKVEKPFDDKFRCYAGRAESASVATLGCSTFCMMGGIVQYVPSDDAVLQHIS